MGVRGGGEYRGTLNGTDRTECSQLELNLALFSATLPIILIAGDENVSTLKESTMAVMTGALKHFAAVELNIFKVSFPTDNAALKDSNPKLISWAWPNCRKSLGILSIVGISMLS
jgi:hypothetical protein